MWKLLFTLIVIMPNLLWSKDDKKEAGLESYLMIAPDDQNFAMNEFMFDGHKLNNLEFSIGDRPQSKKTVPLKKWIQWRQKWTYLYQNLKETSGCLHPLKLLKRTGGEEKSQKSFCLSNLTQSDRDAIKDLTVQFEKYLYE